MLINLAAVLLPCILIYCAFRFQQGTRLQNYLARRLPNKTNQAPSDDNKPGVATYLCSWLIPLAMLISYITFYKGVAIDGPSLAAYSIIMAVIAGTGLMVSRTKYNHNKRASRRVDK